MDIKNIEENFFAVSRYWGSLNSSLIQSDSITAMSTGVSISDINWVWNEKSLDNTSAKHVSEIMDYYKKLNLRFWWWVYPSGKSAETTRILENSGLGLFTEVPCMAADLNDSLPQTGLKDNIRISTVENKKDLLQWKDVSFYGFEMPERALEQYGAYVSSFNIGAQSPLKLFLAYVDEKPVSTSLVFTNQISAGIYYVSTLPEYRNKGYGLIITQAAMQYAKQCGYKDVILQATPLGARVYLKAGFQEYCRAEIFKL